MKFCTLFIKARLVFLKFWKPLFRSDAFVGQIIVYMPNDQFSKHWFGTLALILSLTVDTWHQSTLVALHLPAEVPSPKYMEYLLCF